MQKIKARIVGMGAYLPKRIFKNEEFESMVETSDEWIVTRTGIKERRVAADNEFTSDMGFQAAKEALEKAKMTASEIDLIIMATMSPDYISSSSAAIVQSLLDIPNTPAFDIQAACSGFLYALSTAKAYVESGMYKNILVICSEKMSTYIDYSDRTTCILFGDGAGAAVVSNKGEGLAIDTIAVGADGKGASLISIPAGGVRSPATPQTVAEKMHYIRMEGKEVFKFAVRQMMASAKKCLEDAGLTEGDVRWLVPHQANIRIMEAILKGFEIPNERMYQTIHKYGNTSASSIPIALSELTSNHSLLPNEHILLVAFGAGFTWGAAILTKIEG